MSARTTDGHQKSHTIKDVRAKHSSGRCYGFSIRTDNGQFHIDEWTLYKSLLGLKIDGLTDVESKHHEKQELIDVSLIEDKTNEWDKKDWLTRHAILYGNTTEEAVKREKRGKK